MAKRLTVIFKPTTRCNLKCHYCYEDREQTCFAGKMGLDEALGAFDWTLRFCLECGIANVTVLWHGGEPLLMGVDFIETVVGYYTELFTRHSIQVQNQIQTNLTLATKDFYQLFKNYFKVGFSFDYKSSHRVFPDGTDASDAILSRAMQLKEAGVPAGAICLMTAENSNDILGMYLFFKSRKIPFRLNRIFPTSSERTRGMADTVSAECYAKGVCELIDIWLSDPDPFQGTTTARVAVGSFLNNTSCMCSVMGDCYDQFIGILPGGTLVPCTRFDPDMGAIGNWKTDNIQQVMQNRKALAEQAYNKGELINCSKCKWQSFCQAGCMYQRLTGGWMDECLSNRIIWPHIEARLSPLGLERGILAKLSCDEASVLLKSMFGSLELEGDTM